MLETAVDSFVLRFVHELPGSETEKALPVWHGIIRHVQTEAELRFTGMDEALAFIATFVPLPGAEEPPPPGKSQA